MDACGFAGENLVSKSSQQMEASVGRRTGVLPLHCRRSRDDVSARDVIGGDSGDSPERGRCSTGQLPDVTGSPSATEALRTRLMMS